MCGIVGFCGRKNALPFLMDGLERLQYRGYDSAGIALINKGELQVFKAQGKLESLRIITDRLGKNTSLSDSIKKADTSYKKIKNQKRDNHSESQNNSTASHNGDVVASTLNTSCNDKNLKNYGTGIGHTRWATHGAPSDKNAHPHLSRTGKFAVVHNGIIENHAAIKEFLLRRSFPFESETDTEVIGHLIEYYYRGDPIGALVSAAQRLSGSYALAVLCTDFPDTIFAMRKESPLVIGISPAHSNIEATKLKYKKYGEKKFAAGNSSILNSVEHHVESDSLNGAIDSAKANSLSKFRAGKTETTAADTESCGNTDRICDIYSKKHPNDVGDFYDGASSKKVDSGCTNSERESSLVTEGGSFLASDMSALLAHTRDFILPDAGEIAILRPNSISIVNFNREHVEKAPFHVDWKEDAAQKNGFPHFMLKEIYEQPAAVRDTLFGLNQNLEKIEGLKNPKRLSLIACGSAYHAGLLGRYFIENLCRIPTFCEMASEYRYKNPINEEGTLTVAISQSGETADTIAALVEAKKATQTLSIVNVLGSTVTRISDEVLYTLAGPEIAVPTTKGYLSQAAALCKIGLYLRRQQLKNSQNSLLKEGHNGNFAQFEERHDVDKRQIERNHTISSAVTAENTCKESDQKTLSVKENIENPTRFADNERRTISTAEVIGKALIEVNELERQLEKLPADIEKLLLQKEIFQQLSVRFAPQTSAFFIGRGIDYAVAMEGALKLKEISYIHAQSYPAGELKHGTISLIEKGSLVVAVSTQRAMSEKMANSIAEVRSRGAVVLSVTCFDSVTAASDFSVRINEGLKAPLLAAVSLQLFSYYVALARGCDIDQPRNLAKSVTVE